MNLGTLAAIAYGLLAIGGGIMGYVKVQSKMSLIAGVAGGGLLVASGVMSAQGVFWGLIAAAIVTLVLTIAMIVRYAKTRAFMPAGLMTILGAIALTVMVQQLGVIG